MSSPTLVELWPRMWAIILLLLQLGIRRHSVRRLWACSPPIPHGPHRKLKKGIHRQTARWSHKLPFIFFQNKERGKKSLAPPWEPEIYQHLWRRSVSFSVVGAKIMFWVVSTSFFRVEESGGITFFLLPNYTVSHPRRLIRNNQMDQTVHQSNWQEWSRHSSSG
jgi:hypothetical protein